MVIQGERIYPLDVEKVVDNIFGNTQHAKRKQSLANAALGVIESACLIVQRYTSIAQIFQESNIPMSNVDVHDYKTEWATWTQQNEI
jgi:hypothetical protein